MANNKDDKQQIGLTPEANEAIAQIAIDHFGGSQQDATVSPFRTRSAPTSIWKAPRKVAMSPSTTRWALWRPERVSVTSWRSCRLETRHARSRRPRNLPN